MLARLAKVHSRNRKWGAPWQNEATPSDMQRVVDDKCKALDTLVTCQQRHERGKKTVKKQVRKKQVSKRD